MKGKDFFLDLNGRKEWLFNNFINTKNTHGSGCTLSAAICGYKSLGFDLFDSIQKAKLFVEKSLDKSYKITKIIDPVMVTRTGSKLLEDSAINAYKKLLLPIADLVTPVVEQAYRLT